MKAKCKRHQVELVCPVCEGLRGARKAKRMITPAQRRAWGKRGGRPRNPSRNR